MYNPYQPQFSMYQPTQMQQNILPQQQIMQTNGKPTFDTFRMSPNSSILIADTSAPIVWRCTSDGLGNVTSEAFDITPHKDAPTLDVASITAILSEMNTRITKLEEMNNDKSTIRKSTKHNADDKANQKQSSTVSNSNDE